MDEIFGASADAMFNATIQQQTQLDNLSNNALSSGIEKYVNGDYEGAAKEFKRAIGLAPQSQYSATASDYMAQAYLQLGNTDKAIEAYETAIDLNPTLDEPHVKLGKLYFSMGKYADAETEYLEAVRLNPNSVNYYSLGQVHLQMERYNDAESDFKKVVSLSPDEGYGNYGIGLAYHKMGRYTEAISEFEQALNVQKEFYDAYVDLGAVYADMGEVEKAEELVDFLEDIDPALANLLNGLIYEAEPPNIAFAYATSTFSFGSGPNSLVSSLDSYLETADTSMQFSMIIQFDKEMDIASVEDKLNWSISRDPGSGPGGSYNFGMEIPDTEAEILPIPDNVSYDPESLIATVVFTVNQNSTADATIDPSHIVFKFKGEDAYGNTIDVKGDEYSGFSGVA